MTTSRCDHLLKRPLATYSFDPTGLFWDLPRRLRTWPVLPWCSPDLFGTLLPTSPEIFLPSLLILEPFSPYLSGYLLAFNLSLPLLRFFLPSPSFWNPFPCLSGDGDHESNVCDKVQTGLATVSSNFKPKSASVALHEASALTWPVDW